MNLSTTFAALFSISTAAAQTTTPDYESMVLIQSLGLKDELPKPGYNMEGGSVFDNYVKARRDGQFFLVSENNIQWEKPSSIPITVSLLVWCTDLNFIGDSMVVGYTAQCVKSFLGDSSENSVNAGAELPYVALTPDDFTATMTLSASYNAQTNMFNMVEHMNRDNYVAMHSDSGLSSMPYLSWKTHDEGDPNPNADTGTLSGTGQSTWVSTEEAALLLNNNATDFTPEKFDEIYEKVWNNNHSNDAAQQTTTSDVDESSTNEEEEESTDADVDTNESSTSEEEEESTAPDTTEEDDESGASNGRRRLFVAVTSMFSTLLGSSV